MNSKKLFYSIAGGLALMLLGSAKSYSEDDFKLNYEIDVKQERIEPLRVYENNPCLADGTMVYINSLQYFK